MTRKTPHNSTYTQVGVLAFNYYFSDEFTRLDESVNKIAFFDYSNLKCNLHYRVDCILLDSLMAISQRKLFKNIPEQHGNELRNKILEWANEKRTEPIKRIFPSFSQDINQELTWIKFIIEYEGESTLETCINLDDKRINTC